MTPPMGADVRVALVGNMNNNHFALLRYFHDLGVEAHLLMYSNEAQHFHPRHDTWQWERWAPYVHELSVSNGGHDSLLATRRRIERELGAYDVYVANGIAPVLFRRARRRLDMFIPYAEGIEFIIEHHWRWRRPLSSAFTLLRKRAMERALPNTAARVVTPNRHDHAQDTFRRLAIEPLIMPAPIVYVEQCPPSDALSPHVQDAIARMSRSSLAVFSHVSHIWKTLPVPHFMGGVGKRNNWLVEGFAAYVRESNDRDALLVLVEYGRDVDATKALVRTLGVEAQVHWMPMLSRRELLCLLPYANVGGSEFAGMTWGSCGWEFLASGVPMLHQLADPEQYATVDMPLAPFFNVHSPDEIARVLLSHSREELRAAGARGQAWFERYQGHGLARRYLEILGVLRSSGDAGRSASARGAQARLRAEKAGPQE